MSGGQATTILLHGKLADMLGRSLEIAAANGCSVAQLRDQIAAEHPHAAEAIRNGRVRACIGETIVPDSHRVDLNEQVEFLPPVSGG